MVVAVAAATAQGCFAIYSLFGSGSRGTSLALEQHRVVSPSGRAPPLTPLLFLVLIACVSYFPAGIATRYTQGVPSSTWKELANSDFPPLAQPFIKGEASKSSTQLPPKLAFRGWDRPISRRNEPSMHPLCMHFD